ncbi:MAG: hypothetical protein MUP25_02565, partial [Syntrophales bacterium]|nr:hypothetical protein [Syntrophales bacterium]
PKDLLKPSTSSMVKTWGEKGKRVKGEKGKAIKNHNIFPSRLGLRLFGHFFFCLVPKIGWKTL